METVHQYGKLWLGQRYPHKSFINLRKPRQSRQSGWKQKVNYWWQWFFKRMCVVDANPEPRKAHGTFRNALLPCHRFWVSYNRTIISVFIEIWSRLLTGKYEPFVEIVRRRMLQWFGHMSRQARTLSPTIITMRWPAGKCWTAFPSQWKSEMTD